MLSFPLSAPDYRQGSFLEKRREFQTKIFLCLLGKAIDMEIVTIYNNVTMNSNASSIILQTSGLTKRFGIVTALDHMDFDLRKGEVHALVGENGAGKSTFVKLLSGVYTPTEGGFSIGGEEKVFHGPKDAMGLVGLVHQDREIIPGFNGYQNLFVGNEETRFGFIRSRSMKAQGKALVEKYGIDVDMDTPVELLSPGQQEMITILKILLRNPQILIFDEPTASLSSKESEILFSLIRSLRDKGFSIIYISHRLPEVLDLSDRITVLRNGHKVATVDNEGVTESSLISMMINRNLENQYPVVERTVGDDVFTVNGYAYEAEHFEDISFHVRHGEIVGFAGLVGAGRTELFKSIFLGKGKNTHSITIDGVAATSSSPRASIKDGIVMVPEDRRNEGVILPMGVKDNLILPNMDLLTAVGFRKEKQIQLFASDIVKKLSVVVADVDQPIATLSGGNQQKVAIGKWLSKNARLWIFDEPTQGIDVETKSEIYRMLGTLARDGAGVVFISSDLRELTELSDRIYVMKGRHIVGEFATPYDDHELLTAMIGE